MDAFRKQYGKVLAKFLMLVKAFMFDGHKTKAMSLRSSTCMLSDKFTGFISLSFSLSLYLPPQLLSYLFMLSCRIPSMIRA